MITKKNFTESEKEEARKNSFILIGITGKGKSQIIKYLTGDKNAKVSVGMKSCTPYSSLFYGELQEDGNKKLLFCLIDTAGLCDSDGSYKDKENYNNIRNTLIDNKCEIKGIFVVENFQDERMDGEKRKVIQSASDLFPLKNFWKYVTFIFTHYYDQGKYRKKEKIKLSKEPELLESVKTIMNEVKKRINSIDIIDPHEIKKLYINIDNDVIENKIDPEEMKFALEELEEIKNILHEEILRRIKMDPLYDEVKDGGEEKFIIRQEASDFYYNIYECQVKKRIFYLKSKPIFIDYIAITDKIFKEKINKGLFYLEKFGKGLWVADMALCSPIYKGIDIIMNGKDSKFEILPALSIVIKHLFPKETEKEFRKQLY